jgi:hypothetical protein
VVDLAGGVLVHEGVPSRVVERLDGRDAQAHRLGSYRAAPCGGVV